MNVKINYYVRATARLKPRMSSAGNVINPMCHNQIWRHLMNDKKNTELFQLLAVDSYDKSSYF